MTSTATTVYIVAAVAFVLTAAAPAPAGTQEGADAFRAGQFAKALRELQPAAKEGDPEAHFVLGEMYSSGLGVAKDALKATGHFKAAAEKGHSQSQQRLGTALMLGEGIEQDMVEALKWFIVAAQRGAGEAGTYAQNVAKFMTPTMQAEARTKARLWIAAFEKNNPNER